MTAARFVIIGDGAAGLTAAKKLRQKSPLSPITLLSDDPHPAYYRAALTNYLLGELSDNQVWAASPSFFYDYRLERLLNRVTSLDGQRRMLYLANGATLPYDGLLIASGAHARHPTFEGAQLGGVWTFRTLHDARGMLDTIATGRLTRAVIIGGGPLAIEWAMALLERGVAATMLVRGQRVMEREIDATGLLVAPGWVDIHTHYDGQVTWDPHLTPSGWNGVTTVVMGNCGVGFAPVKPGQEEFLIQLMEGVDDKRRATLSDAASQTKAEPSISERFRAGATPLRAATTSPPPLLDVADVEGHSSSLSLDEAQFESVPLY